MAIMSYFLNLRSRAVVAFVGTNEGEISKEGSIQERHTQIHMHKNHDTAYQSFINSLKLSAIGTLKCNI